MVDANTIQATCQLGQYPGILLLLRPVVLCTSSREAKVPQPARMLHSSRRAIRPEKAWPPNVCRGWSTVTLLGALSVVGFGRVMLSVGAGVTPKISEAPHMNSSSLHRRREKRKLIPDAL